MTVFQGAAGAPFFKVVKKFSDEIFSDVPVISCHHVCDNLPLQTVNNKHTCIKKNQRNLSIQ
jgi:hypothetical protein